MALIQIAHNAVHAKLINAPDQVKLEVSKLLSYQVAGAEHSAAFQEHRWDGRSTLFTYKTASFPAGFVHMVYADLRRRGHNIQVIRAKLPEALGAEFPVVDSFGDDPRYDYQNETVRRLVKHGTMIAQIATGGGKSRIAKKCYARIKRPTLFLTTRSVLMYQMKTGFEEMGLDVGVMGDSVFAPRRGINVAMVQTIAPRLADPAFLPTHREREAQAIARAKMRKILEIMEFVIGEEAHEIGAEGYYDILEACKNARYRLALTATPFMREDEEANMRLMASFGPVGIQVTEKELIETGILATPYFKRIKQPNPPLTVRVSSSWQRAYDLGIVKNAWRNTEIVSESVRAAQYGLSVLILVQRKEHGRLLKEQLAGAGLRVGFIFGETAKEHRDLALKKLKTGELQVLIGSTILDVGVDAPAVGMIILAGGGKAEVQLRQRIGRGLRSKKNMPNVCLVVDFLDDFNKHLRTHAKTRFMIVDNTPGFAENVLPKNADFDFAGLGLNKL